VFLHLSKKLFTHGDSMHANFVDALTVRIESQLIAVLSTKQLPSERKLRQALLNGVSRASEFDRFVVVEKFDAVHEELIAVDVEKAAFEVTDGDRGGGGSSDLTFELAAAAMGKLQFKGGGNLLATCNFLHRPSGLKAFVQNHIGTPHSFEVTLLRAGNTRVSLRELELKHAYLELASVQIALDDSPALQVSLLAAHLTVYSETGKLVIVALRGDALTSSKKKSQSHELNAASQLKIVALIKHIAASLHIAQASVQVLLIWPSQDADFKAAEWGNDCLQPTLKWAVSAGGLVALAELASLPGSVVQGIARVLPGVPTRIRHLGGIVEMMASNTGVTRTVRVLPVAQGKLFSHSI
jgi:hypothetical protein